MARKTTAAKKTSTTPTTTEAAELVERHAAVLRFAAEAAPVTTANRYRVPLRVGAVKVLGGDPEKVGKGLTLVGTKGGDFAYEGTKAAVTGLLKALEGGSKSARLGRERVVAALEVGPLPVADERGAA